MLSELATVTIDGDELSDDELTMFLVQLLVAGNETTRNMLSAGLVALADAPVQWRRLVDDPGLVRSAVEEILRYTTPVISFMRTATRDTTSAANRSQKVSRCCCCSPRRTATKTSSGPTRTSSTSGAIRIRTWRSVSATTSASGRALARLEGRVVLEELLGQVLFARACRRRGAEPVVCDRRCPARGALLLLRPDHRGSPIPTFGMIATRYKELRKRRGLMIALILVTVGFPAVYLAIRLILHAALPKTYGAAGGYDTYTGMTAGVLFIFGFIVSATLGCTAGSIDLTEGMFRHLVVTGRSRLALYLARIPAGLAIIVTLVAIGFTIVCAVCVFAAPATLSYNGLDVPAGLSPAGLASWATAHPDEVVCNFPFVVGPNQSIQASSPVVFVIQNVPCNSGPGPAGAPTGSGSPQQPTRAQITAAARQLAAADYADYSSHFLYPSDSLMVRTGLWIELEAAIGFIVGLGLGSLIGQRTIGVVLMIVLEVVLTPILSRAQIPHLLNFQRAVVGLATAHLAPGGIPVLGGGGGGPGAGSGNPALLPESTTVAVCVIVAWLVVWSILGAWRMMTRDA